MNLMQYNITINPIGLAGAASQQYVRQVTEHLTWIERTKSGKILLNAIRFHGKPLTIQPYTAGNCNAVGGGGHVAGSRVGNVWYSPSTFSRGGACPAKTTPQNRGLYWDEILFHELFHVFRWVSGKFNNSVPLQFGMTQYSNQEEFIAVLVTNIYISDRSNKIKSGLRANHATWGQLPATFDESFELFSQSRQVYKLIDKFCQENKGLTKRLANDLADSPFNPIADYYANRDKAKTLSDNAPYSNDISGLFEDMAKQLDKLLN